jgi:predicted DNA binding CopG/RHH family protein
MEGSIKTKIAETADDLNNQGAKTRRILTAKNTNHTKSEASRFNPQPSAFNHRLTAKNAAIAKQRRTNHWLPFMRAILNLIEIRSQSKTGQG